MTINASYGIMIRVGWPGCDTRATVTLAAKYTYTRVKGIDYILEIHNSITNRW